MIMNILYIGPIESKSLSGIQSRHFLHNISQLDHNIYAKSYGSKDSGLDQDLFFLTNKPIITDIDLVIEHKPLSDTSVNNMRKSILIPIFDTYDDINIYQEYSDIVVCKNIEANILSNSGISSIIVDNPYIDTKCSKDIDIKHYGFRKTIYAILDLKTDNNLCTSIIDNVSTILPKMDNYCMIILLNNSNDQLLNKHSNYISSLSNSIGVDLTEYVLLLNSSDCNIDNIKSIHKKCDIFLDINSHQSINCFNYHMAKNIGNTILTNITTLVCKRGKLETAIQYENLVNALNISDKTQEENTVQWQDILK